MGKHKTLTVEQFEAIKADYASYRDRGKLADFAAKIGMTRAVLLCHAGKMGLRNANFTKVYLRENPESNKPRYYTRKHTHCTCGKALESRSRYCSRDCLEKKGRSKCKDCGKEVSRNSKTGRCVQCRGKSSRLMSLWNHTCHTCGKEFESNRDPKRNKNMFCSIKCVGQFNKVNKKKPCRVRVKVKSLCVMCKCIVGFSAISCKKCKPILSRAVHRFTSGTMACVNCGGTVLSGYRFCSKSCREANYRRSDSYRASLTTARHTRRHRLIGAEKFTPQEIFERDGYVCSYCHCTVKQYESGGWLADDEATLDHVIPLSCGGSHTRDNVVTSCRPCNCYYKIGKTIHYED